MTALAPYRGGTPLAPERFNAIRRSMVLDHCKWDPQVGDTGTLADFPLIMSRDTWRELAAWAEALTAEADAAEHELAERPDLLARLGLPRRLRHALQPHKTDHAVAAPAPRAYRYDFHLTTEGWRISECNADVPGGYAEASAFTALMAEHYPTLEPAGDPARAWAQAVARTTQADDVALVSAAGFMEDAQVIHYLATRLHQQGLRARCLQPAQVVWHDGTACFGARQLGALVCFYKQNGSRTCPRLPRRTTTCAVRERPSSIPARALPSRASASRSCGARSPRACRLGGACCPNAPTRAMSPGNATTPGCSRPRCATPATP